MYRKSIEIHEHNRFNEMEETVKINKTGILVLIIALYHKQVRENSTDLERRPRSSKGSVNAHCDRDQ